jgi:ABC-2 type transport system permease protein
MNQTMRAVFGSILVLIIMFSAISICQNAAGRVKIDVTEQKLYTLSAGTKKILGKINQPVTAKLFYTKTAAMKGPDQIKFFNNYYEYVRALLEEYAAVSSGMVKLQLIDPRPYSDEESEAISCGLKQYRVSEEESFFFGLVIQTQYGVEKTIPFFTPDRQTFTEYDISYLIDTVISRRKTRIGILSSLSVMGDNMSDYMAQLTRQTPTPPWTFVEHLRKMYEVTGIGTDVNDINNIDILLVVHPKDLPKQTQFAIDQFVLRGGRTIICVDPFCFADNSGRSAMTSTQSRNSELNTLINNWGLIMPKNTFAGDLDLMQAAQLSANSRRQDILGLLDLKQGCFNTDNVITAQLKDVLVLFAGSIKESVDPNKPDNIKRTPLIMTTGKGNIFTINSPYELTVLEPSNLLKRFTEGSKPVVMGYFLTGRFTSSFPEGVEIESKPDEQSDPNQARTKYKLTGLTQSQADGAVAVFSDVDFISDNLAYNIILGIKTISGDNSALLLNTIEDMCGSSDLVAIRSRGSFKRPFVVVDEIEKKAAAETQKQIDAQDLAIATLNARLQNIVSSAKQTDRALISSQIEKQKRVIEEQIYKAEQKKNKINMTRYERIENLGTKLQNANTLAVPAVILVFAIILSIRGSLRKRHYISHTSDA